MLDNSNAENNRALQKRIQERLDRLADYPSGMVDLGYALVRQATSTDEQACDACQASLPEYIEAELNGEPVRRRFASVARHLELCPSCARIYVDLLEIALQTEEEPLPVPPQASALDLGFLQPLNPSVRMRRLVERLVEELLGRLTPEALKDLALVGQEFFRSVDALEINVRLQPASTLALGFGTDLPPALRSLVAAYNATDTILHTLSTEELADELGGPRYPRTVERQARSSVQATGMGGKEAKEWAELYVVVAQAHAAEFLTLARQIAENEYSD